MALPLGVGMFRLHCLADQRVPLALFRQKEPVDDASACANWRVSAIKDTKLLGGVRVPVVVQEQPWEHAGQL